VKARIGEVVYQIRDRKRLSVRSNDGSVFIKIKGEVKLGLGPMRQSSKVLGEERADFFLGIRRKLHICGQNVFRWGEGRRGRARAMGGRAYRIVCPNIKGNISRRGDPTRG